VVAQCEWVFWEAVGLLVGSLGVVSLSVHTIPNQTIMAFCMIPFSFGIALAIRMGIALPISVTRTKILVVFVLFFSVIAFGIVSIGVYIYRRSIVALFTSNQEVQELAELIFVKVALFNFNIAIFAILAGIATGLGKQWLLGIINFIFLWIFGLPMIYYKSIVCGQGLNAVWYWMNVPYLGMNITLCILFSCYLDWYKIQTQIVHNENNNTIVVEEEKVIAKEEVEVEEEDKWVAAAAADEKTTLLRIK
jgi:Na+-driven multidrug efflux pump